VSLLELKYETENEEKFKTGLDKKSPHLNVSKYSVSLSDFRVLETAVSDSLGLEMLLFV